MVETESYVCKKEVDWSVLMEGFTLPIENQVVFLQNIRYRKMYASIWQFIPLNYEDTFLVEPIIAGDIQFVKAAVQGMHERSIEAEFDYE